MILETLTKIFGSLLPLKWTGIMSIATFGVVVVALIPIIRNWIQRRKASEIIRLKVFNEINYLNDQLKIKKQHVHTPQGANPFDKKSVYRPGFISQNERESIEKLFQLFESSSSLRRRELKLLNPIVFLLNYTLRNGYGTLTEEGVNNLYELTSKLGNRLMRGLSGPK